MGALPPAPRHSSWVQNQGHNWRNFKDMILKSPITFHLGLFFKCRHLSAGQGMRKISGTTFDIREENDGLYMFLRHYPLDTTLTKNFANTYPIM